MKSTHQTASSDCLNCKPNHEHNLWCSKHQLNHGQKYKSCNPPSKDQPDWKSPGKVVKKIKGDNDIAAAYSEGYADGLNSIDSAPQPDTLADDNASGASKTPEKKHGPCCTCQTCGKNYDDCSGHSDVPNPKNTDKAPLPSQKFETIEDILVHHIDFIDDQVGYLDAVHALEDYVDRAYEKGIQLAIDRAGEMDLLVGNRLYEYIKETDGESPKLEGQSHE